MGKRRTLGLDLGTNSIGWAIVEQENGEMSLADAGVVIFQEGVARDKNNEKPATQDRTQSRSQRRLYFRRRMRKQKVLELLVEQGMCPLPSAAVKAWIKKGEYPLGHPEFKQWFMMNPYELRAKAISEKLTLHELGRVFYHIAQRRGFRSNRKGGAGELDGLKGDSEERGIKGLNDTAGLIAEHGTLGKAGVALAKKHQAIRRRYTMRTDYIAEFDMIWKEQQKHYDILTDKLKNKLGHPKDGLLFFQRPLKSQKGNVGKCTLEPNKPRAPISSLHAEVFNVLQTMNNLRVDDKPLNDEQRAVALEKFLAKSPQFTAKSLSSALKKAKVGGRLNYDEKVKFNAAHTIPILAEVFDGDSLEIFNQPDNKEWEDRWAVIYNAEETDEISKEIEKGRDVGSKRDLRMYAKEVWELDDEKLEILEKKANWKHGYHRLSRKALRKIIPFMAQGLRYDEAVMFANLAEVVDGWEQMSQADREALQQGLLDRMDEHAAEGYRVDIMNMLIKRYREEHTPVGGKEDFWDEGWTAAVDKAIEQMPEKLMRTIQDPEAWRASVSAEVIANTKNDYRPAFFKKPALKDVLKGFLEDQFGEERVHYDKMYHHSAIEQYPVTKEEKLGSPRVPGLKNPMVERALHTLRHLVNELIATGKVDRNTRVNLELAREMDTTNRRKAWQNWQKDRREKREKAIKRIKEHPLWKKGEPSESIVERMWLFQELEDLYPTPVCIYTGHTIGVESVFSPKIEVDHIWPRSKTIDNSKANKMLCYKWYNKEIKRDVLPALLPNFEADCTLNGKLCTPIKPRLEPIKERIDKHKKQMRGARQGAQIATTKEGKASAIQRAETARHHFNYWRTKYEHLNSAKLELNFLNRQIVGTGMISRIARVYLGTYFRNEHDRPAVYAYQGEATAAFRKAWLGETFDAPKDRTSHAHHAKDAAVLAALDLGTFHQLASHYKEHDQKDNIDFPEPWAGFCKEVNTLDKRILVYHDRLDRVGTRSKYYLGKVNGKKRFATGDTVRGSLHRETYYGRIRQRVEGTDEFTEHTVLRKPLKSLADKDIPKIVDPALREQVKRYGLKRIKEQGYMPVEVKEGGKMVEHQVRRVRVFDTAPIAKNPTKVKLHRDRPPGMEHKHYLYAASGDLYGMGVYANAKGKRTFLVLSVQEIMALMDTSDTSSPKNAWPKEHPEKVGFKLIERNGEPQLFITGTKVLMYENSPDEIDLSDPSDLNKRLYVVRNVEGDGRINFAHHLDGRPGEEMRKDQRSAWDVEDPVAWHRITVGKLKALVEGVEFELNRSGVLVVLDSITAPV